MNTVTLRQLTAALVLPAFAVLLCGCGDGGPARLPVSGKVTISTTEPIASVGISFVPDPARSPALKDIPSAVAENGSYTLYTNGKPGAPAGWYKVIFAVKAAPDPKSPYAPPKAIVNPRYAKAETTDIAVEVVPNPKPGAYDFTLTP